MFDLLQITPDVVNQVIDSTEFLVEPMQAILDSIRANTGQTALNTIRDEEVFLITKKDYYIAVVAIVVAIVSLVVDILTTIFQHISSSSSRLMSAKYTFEVQKSIAAGMIYKLYFNTLLLMGIRHRLQANKYTQYVSRIIINRLKTINNLELDALCIENPGTLRICSSVFESLQNLNYDIDILHENLKDPKINDSIKSNEIENTIFLMAFYAYRLYELITKLGSKITFDEDLSEILNNFRKRKDYNDLVDIPSDEIFKIVVDLYGRIFQNDSNSLAEVIAKDYVHIYTQFVKDMTLIPISE